MAAKVFHHEELSQHQLQVDTNSEDTGIKFNSDKHSHQHDCTEQYSEINVFEDIKFTSNFGSLPFHDQKKLLDNGGQSVKGEKELSVYNLTANLQSKSVPEKKIN